MEGSSGRAPSCLGTPGGTPLKWVRSRRVAPSGPGAVRSPAAHRHPLDHPSSQDSDHPLAGGQTWVTGAGGDTVAQRQVGQVLSQDLSLGWSPANPRSSDEAPNGQRGLFSPGVPYPSRSTGSTCLWPPLLGTTPVSAGMKVPGRSRHGWQGRMRASAPHLGHRERRHLTQDAPGLSGQPRVPEGPWHPGPVRTQEAEAGSCLVFYFIKHTMRSPSKRGVAPPRPPVPALGPPSGSANLQPTTFL